MLSLLPGIQISLIVFLFLGKCQVLGDILLGQILADLNAVNVNITTMSTGPLIRAHKHGKSLIVSFKCSALFDDLVNRKRPSVWPPPKTPPTEMLPAYTMEGQVPIINWYIEEKQNGGEGYDWPVEMLADLGGKKNICGGYKLSVCATSLKKYENDFIANKTGLVFGSQSPWAEAALLYQHRASHVTTVEYMKITTTQPNLDTLHPTELGRNYLAKKIAPVDFAFSYSSFEHDGLGRYGDPLNPFGDLEAIARVHCLLKPNGVLFLGLGNAPDALIWNAHRLYGVKRMSLVLTNWEIIDVVGMKFGLTDMKNNLGYLDIPMWVLRKKPLQHQERAEPQQHDRESKEKRENRENLQQHGKEHPHHGQHHGREHQHHNNNAPTV